MNCLKCHLQMHLPTCPFQDLAWELTHPEKWLDIKRPTLWTQLTLLAWTINPHAQKSGSKIFEDPLCEHGWPSDFWLRWEPTYPKIVSKILKIHFVNAATIRPFGLDGNPYAQKVVQRFWRSILRMQLTLRPFGLNKSLTRPKIWFEDFEEPLCKRGWPLCLLAWTGNPHNPKVVRRDGQ